MSHYGCERSALPAELRAQISTFHAKKVANFGFLKYTIFRGKSNKSNRKTGNRKPDRMCLTMDANRALSQLSYRPIFNNDIYYSLSDQICKALFCKKWIFFANLLPYGCWNCRSRRPARHRPSAELPRAGPILHNTEPSAPIHIGADGLSYALSTKIWESKSQAAGSSG